MAETKHTLVIVESPAKAKTIGKFLGTKFKVIASNGHVRDLPKSQLGVDVEHDFMPKYITLRGRGDVLEHIKKEAKDADLVAPCADPEDGSQQQVPHRIQRDHGGDCQGRDQKAARDRYGPR